MFLLAGGRRGDGDEGSELLADARVVTLQLALVLALIGADQRLVLQQSVTAPGQTRGQGVRVCVWSGGGAAAESPSPLRHGCVM